jgi:aryl-alcohol dehydrogenase-like predicted oxidoreductase
MQMNSIRDRIVIGHTNEVARLGYGTMRLTGPKAWGAPKDPGAARAVLRRALDLGVQLIDTAGFYGPGVTNRLIHEALSPYARELFISTKVGVARGGDQSWQPHARPEQIRRDIETNLAELGVEQLDLVHLRLGDGRMLAYSDVPLSESIGALAMLRNQGKIRHIGLSAASVDQIKDAERIVAIASIQNMYNAGNDVSQGVLDYCGARHIAFLPYFPLSMGSLAGADSTLAAIAKNHGATPGQIALAWLLHVSEQTVPIPGTSNLRHLEENMAAAQIQLSPADMQAIRQAGRPTTLKDTPNPTRP